MKLERLSWGRALYKDSIEIDEDFLHRVNEDLYASNVKEKDGSPVVVSLEELEKVLSGSIANRELYKGEDFRSLVYDVAKDEFYDSPKEKRETLEYEEEDFGFQIVV